MFLSDRDIRKAVDEGAIVIRDFDRERLGPASYDVILDNQFSITEPHKTPVIDPMKKIFPKTKEVEVADGEEFMLFPGETILGKVRDYIGSREYLIQISGKSSLARIGLVVHNTAGIINPGHFLNITLELSNLNRVPIVLRPGMQIAQLTFSCLTSPVEHDYEKTGRFNGDNFKKNFAPTERKKSDVSQGKRSAKKKSV
ncbi:MAG: dCTP deaminase [Candidatus Moranbacteria bacterium]|jgi:dCTP deaminase|nr:dCTP deaminase [Candidatus Moranbacteria bacterium]